MKSERENTGISCEVRVGVRGKVIGKGVLREMGMSAEMKFLGKMLVPMRKAWTKFAYRLHFRRTGLVKLHRDVKTCEYEDVHILWEMVKRYEKEMATSSASCRGRQRWDMVYCAPFQSRSM
nr:Cyclic pyranopterin monophosphate synthase [Ipomoea batatas]